MAHGATNLFTSHRWALPGLEKGLVMKNCLRLLASAALLALAGMVLVPDAPGLAAEQPAATLLPETRNLAQTDPSSAKPRSRIRIAHPPRR